MDWDVRSDNGIWLPQIGWRLDARLPAERSFVSHAHFDHAAAHREILCSAGTARLLRSRLPGERVEHVLPFGHAEQLTQDTDVTLYPAGHIFGSAQCLLRHAGRGSLLYSGDFKLRPGLSAEPCETPHADLLVMETTYGLPRYVFPPTEAVLDSVVAFCEEALAESAVPVLFGYSLGKSQELLSRLSLSGLKLMLHSQTLRLTRIYEEFGQKFPGYRPLDPAQAAGHTIVCPPQAAGSGWILKLPSARTAILTGWALDPGAVHRYQCDAAFPLSDHADYPDLLRYVEQVRPRKILTLHGFASQFAADLRERGWEAWAINEPNQLEFGWRGSSPAKTAPATAGDIRGGADAAAEAPRGGTFRRFAAVADGVAATPRKLEKIALLKDFFEVLSVEDLGRAARFLTGRPFAQSDGRTLQVGWAALRRAVLEASGGTEEEFGAAYHRFADAGDSAGTLLRGRTKPKPTALEEVAAFFANVASARRPDAKVEVIARRLSSLTSDEARYLVKIMTGDLRIGLKEGLVEEAVAAATGVPLEAVREANMLSGDIGEVAAAARQGTLAQIELRVFHPIQFMLASPEPDAAAVLARLGSPVWLEEKYDGIRCQLHRAGGRVELFSRDLHRITGQFPDLARAALELPGDFVLDGELLAWRNGRALPFSDLQRRLGRQGEDFFLGAEIPVSLSAYDLLWRDGRALLRAPLSERRALLEDLLRGGAGAILAAPVRSASGVEEIETAFREARGRGNEGLVAKDPRSPYTPGRRGLAWIKLKQGHPTLDVVVVGAEYGHGKRRDVLSDYTFAVRGADGRLLPVGKAYTGLTDSEIARLTRHFIEQTVEVRGCYRSVAPDVVLEVAFDSIRPSARHASGYALRFPRIVRIRDDKGPGEIDTVDTCRRLASEGGA